MNAFPPLKNFRRSSTADFLYQTGLIIQDPETRQSRLNDVLDQYPASPIALVIALVIAPERLVRETVWTR